MSLSPRTYRWITLAALVSLCVIIVSGGAVRLTASGLGCSDWPNCEPGSLTPHSADDFHAMIEYLNRLFTGVVSLSVALAVLGSLVRRPRRADLTWLSLGLVAGVLGQIVLGGLTVLFELRPEFVMSHFLLSMVLVANAVVLFHRAGQPDPPVDVVRAPHRTRVVARVIVAVAAGVVFTGTIVTGAGPHGGDEEVPRLNVAVETAARIHGLSVIAFLALTVFLLVRVRRAQDRRVATATAWLLGIGLAQGAVGYVQYFTGVPVLLVGIHILGATLVWIAALAVLLSTTDRREAVGVVEEPDVVALGH